MQEKKQNKKKHILNILCSTFPKREQFLSELASLRAYYHLLSRQRGGY